MSKLNWEEEPGFYSLASQNARIETVPANLSIQRYASRVEELGTQESISMVFSGHAGGFGVEVSICNKMFSLGKNKFLMTSDYYHSSGDEDIPKTLFHGTPVGYLIIPEGIIKNVWVQISETLEIFIHESYSAATLRVVGSSVQRWGV